MVYNNHMELSKIMESLTITWDCLLYIAMKESNPSLKYWVDDCR